MFKNNNKSLSKQKLYTVQKGLKKVESDFLQKTPRTHDEITDWLEKAEEWQAKLDEWERDEELSRSSIGNEIGDKSIQLVERIEELSDKKDAWEQRCSMNLCYYYPKHGIELSSDQYSKMFDCNIDEFEEWSFLASMNDDESKGEEQVEKREIVRNDIKDWTFNANWDISTAQDSVKEFEKLIDKVYDQSDVDKMRSILARDLFVDKLPHYLFEKVSHLSTIEECMQVINPIMDKNK